MDIQKTVLKPEDVAEICGVSLRLIYRQLRKGNIPSVKCGDRYLISSAALEKWLSGNDSKSAEAS